MILDKMALNKVYKNIYNIKILNLIYIYINYINIVY